MNKISITVQNEPMQLPCFNFFLGCVSVFVLPTVFSGKRIRFQMKILWKFNIWSRSQDSVITKAQNILLSISGQHLGVAHPQQLLGCSPVTHFEQ